MVLRTAEEPILREVGACRQFWACMRSPYCDGLVGTHPDGTPLGKVVTKVVRQARIRAHDAFDRLWEPKAERVMTRESAYAWLLSKHGVRHIAETGTVEQCDRIEVSSRELLVKLREEMWRDTEKKAAEAFANFGGQVKKEVAEKLRVFKFPMLEDLRSEVQKRIARAVGIPVRFDLEESRSVRELRFSIAILIDEKWYPAKVRVQAWEFDDASTSSDCVFRAVEILVRVVQEKIAARSGRVELKKLATEPTRARIYKRTSADDVPTVGRRFDLDDE